jgi:hypothetical protein
LLTLKDCPPFLELGNLILFKHLGQDFSNAFFWGVIKKVILLHLRLEGEVDIGMMGIPT